MTFIWPLMLIFLLLVPLAVALYTRLQRRRQRLMAAYGTLGLVRQAAGRPLGRRRHIPPALFLAGLAILLLALARPQAVVSLPRQEGTVILGFDVSGSMAATDMQPTRMEAAKAAARDFVQRQPRAVRIGVVAFSDNGLAVQAPTDDRDAVLAAIDRLAPQNGTSLGQGILASLNTLAVDENPDQGFYTNRTPEPAPAPQAPNTSAAIVLLTDGENNESPDPFAAAQAAAQRGVRIYTVGIGSPAGVNLKVNGFNVHTSLDEPTLKQVAQLTEGAYYAAANPDELRAVYENLDLQFVVKPEKTEITAIFAGVGVLLLLIGGICSMLWFSRIP